MTGWNIGIGVVVLLLLLALVVLPRRAARRRAGKDRDGADGAGFWLTGDTGRSHPDRDRASPPDADDPGTGDGGD